MKRVFLVTLALVFIASNPAFAQSGQGNKPQRYSAGIGVGFYEVTEDIVAFGGYRNDERMRFNNKNGRFTGAIFFSQLLKNGPAERAGLESGDMLFQVDGKNISILGYEGVTQKIRSKLIGDSVNLRVGQTDEVGNILREFNVKVVIEEIDEADWVPKDVWFRSFLSNCGTVGNGKWGKVLRVLTFNLIRRDECNYSINFETMVSENQETGEFTYRYKVGNTRGKTVIVRLEAIDISSGAISNLVALDKGVQREFILITNEFPIKISSSLDIHVKPEEWFMDYERRNGFHAPASDYWAGTASGAVTALVPRYYLELYQDRTHWR